MIFLFSYSLSSIIIFWKETWSVRFARHLRILRKTLNEINTFVWRKQVPRSVHTFLFGTALLCPLLLYVYFKQNKWGTSYSVSEFPQQSPIKVMHSNVPDQLNSRRQANFESRTLYETIRIFASRDISWGPVYLATLLSLSFLGSSLWKWSV